VADSPDFQGLRRRGLAHAQAASGHVWTDYNVHDPGVTLLEQFCYAVTEVAYRADLPIEDLLTGPDGRIDKRRLRLGRPEAVLASRPVTARDLALALAVDPEVERVMVWPGTGAEAGRHVLHVVPAEGAGAAAALAAVRRRFHAARSLCEDVGSLALGTPVPCHLVARIEVRRREPPERTAALVYDRCAQFLRDRRALAPEPAATREAAFEDPARLFAATADPDGGVAFLDAFFAALTRLGEVEDVAALAIRRADGGGDALAALPRGAYRTLALPERAADVGLVLVSRGMGVSFDLAGMHAELARLRADREAARPPPRDLTDWAEPSAGRRRRFAHLPQSHGLPPAFGVGGNRPPDPRLGVRAAQLEGYLALSDATLVELVAGLAALPQRLAGDPAEETTGKGEACEYHGHARREEVLDYQLALRGEAFPQHALRLFDRYRGPAARLGALVANRVRLLAEIDALDRDRVAAPDYTASQRCHEVGLGRKLTILLDYPDRGTAPLAAAIGRSGLLLEEAHCPVGRWLLPRSRLEVPGDPFDAVVPRIDDPETITPGRLIEGTAFLAGRTIGADALRRGVAPEAYGLAPFGGGWRLWLDPGAGQAVFDCGVFTVRTAAIQRANQLRIFLAGLNRPSEGLYVVEDALLRGTSLRLSVVQPGWTARTADPEFRRLAEETVAFLCPAHLDHRVLWLEHAEMAEFESRHLAWRVAYRDAATGAADASAAPAAALRDFLDGAR
jgi:hypothetical protein